MNKLNFICDKYFKYKCLNIPKHLLVTICIKSFEVQYLDLKIFTKMDMIFRKLKFFITSFEQLNLPFRYFNFLKNIHNIYPLSMFLSFISQLSVENALFIKRCVNMLLHLSTC